MNDAWKLALAFIFGGGGLALIDWLRERTKFKAERKAMKEDRKEEKADEVKELTKTVETLKETVNKMSDQLNALQDAQRCVLLDRIMYLGSKYIADGEIAFDDRRRLREMHDSYHHGLKGNGDADAIMTAVDALPLKNHS